jgi:hypothetical protein
MPRQLSSIDDPSRMPRSTTAAVLLAMLASFSTGCATGTTASLPFSEPSACEPSFPYRNGWLGGDAAYSVALPGGSAAQQNAADAENSLRTLWLFGDTFVAPHAADREPENRKGSILIHNSIAISRCDTGRFEIEYHWKTNEDGSPRAFFAESDANDTRELDESERYWWLFDGFVHAGALYLGLLEVRNAPNEEVAGLSFRLVGMRLAKVPNPGDPPSEWRFETSKLSDSLDAFPGSAMVLEGGYVYFFSFTRFDDRGRPRFLSRLKLSRLSPFPGDLTAELETLVARERWEPGFDPDRAHPLMDDNASEMSVEFDTDLGRWIAIYGSPVQDGSDHETIRRLYSDQIFLRYADALEGPWSQRYTIYRIPELESRAESSPDPNLVCYAAKGHLAFSSPGEILITYVCNLLAFDGEDSWAILERLSRDMNLYRPRTVVLPQPE